MCVHRPTRRSLNYVAATLEQPKTWSGTPRHSSKEKKESIKPFLRSVEKDSSVLIVDDTILEKSYTDESEINTYHYDHSKGRSIKGINVVNLIHETEGKKLFIVKVIFFLLIFQLIGVISATAISEHKPSYQIKNHTYSTCNQGIRKLSSHMIDMIAPCSHRRNERSV